jgi:hypothetical protein
VGCIANCLLCLVGASSDVSPFAVLFFCLLYWVGAYFDFSSFAVWSSLFIFLLISLNSGFLNSILFLPLFFSSRQS